MAKNKPTEAPKPFFRHKSSNHRPSRLAEIKATLDQAKKDQGRFYKDLPARPTVEIDVGAERCQNMWSPDLHLGSSSTEYELIEKMLNYVWEHPQTALNFLDDVTDASRPGGDTSHRATIDHRAIMRPDKQIVLFKKIAEEALNRSQLGIVLNATIEHTGRLETFGHNVYVLHTA